MGFLKTLCNQQLEISRLKKQIAYLESENGDLKRSMFVTVENYHKMDNQRANLTRMMLQLIKDFDGLSKEQGG